MSWLRSISRAHALSFAVAIGASLAHAGPAYAHDHAPGPAAGEKDMSACSAFKWPIDKERAAFERPDIAKVSSGASKDAWSEQVFALALQPASEVAFSVAPPERKNAPDSFGGTVSFAPPAQSGPYQITISNHAWVDLIQNDAALDTADHSGAKGCDGVRKSIRFDVGAAPVILQISGSPTETVNVSIRPAAAE